MFDDDDEEEVVLSRSRRRERVSSFCEAERIEREETQRGRTERRRASKGFVERSILSEKYVGESADERGRRGKELSFWVYGKRRNRKRWRSG